MRHSEHTPAPDKPPLDGCIVEGPLDQLAEVYAALRARHGGLRAQERVRQDTHRPVRRHRLQPDGRHRRRRARERERGVRGDAVALLVGGQPHRRARRGRQPRRRAADHPHRGGVRSHAAHAGGAVHRRAAQRCGGEPANAHSRQHPHGPVQQARLAGAHHGQQERVRHGLRHALRRHGGRLLGDQGRAEDAGCTSWRGIETITARRAT